MINGDMTLKTPILDAPPSLRILVVEDNEMIASLIAETLEAMGHAVCGTAATQVSAVAAALLHRPDLMLVDVNLAQGSGLSAVKEILRGGPTPHVFMTGDDAIDDRMEAGSITLRKPFQDHDLARAIGRAWAEASK